MTLAEGVRTDCGGAVHFETCKVGVGLISVIFKEAFDGLAGGKRNRETLQRSLTCRFVCKCVHSTAKKDGKRSTCQAVVTSMTYHCVSAENDKIRPFALAAAGRTPGMTFRLSLPRAPGSAAETRTETHFSNGAAKDSRERAG